MTTHTTLDGFKRAAKNLSKQSKLPFNQALEHRARIEGYANYNHAQRLLRAEIRSFKTTFFQNWQKDRRSVEGGCFEASVWTKRDPLTILTPSARQKFMKLYKEPKQSLYRIDGYAEGEDQAKWYVGQCVRFMQFCDATGLTPGTSDYRRDPGARDRCPWADHRRHWWDAVNKAYVVSDEPYESRLLDWKGRTQEWGDSEGVDTLELQWGGIYSESTTMVLFSKKSADIDLMALDKKLLAAQPAIYPELNLSPQKG